MHRRCKNLTLLGRGTPREHAEDCSAPPFNNSWRGSTREYRRPFGSCQLSELDHAKCSAGANRSHVWNTGGAAGFCRHREWADDRGQANATPAQPAHPGLTEPSAQVTAPVRGPGHDRTQAAPRLRPPQAQWPVLNQPPGSLRKNPIPIPTLVRRDDLHPRSRERDLVPH